MHIEFGRKVRKDLEKLPADVRTNIRKALNGEEFAQNIGIKPLKGAEPWLRFRVGPYRIIFKYLTKEQLGVLGVKQERGILVLRVVNRRDLERQVSRLK